MICATGDGRRPPGNNPDNDDERDNEQAGPMRAITVLLAAAVAAVTVLASAIEVGWIVDARWYTLPLLIAAAGLAVVMLLVTAFAGGRGAPVPASTAAPDAGADVARPSPPPAVGHPAEAEVVGFLAMLQEKGRLVDFVMDDITRYGDAQVAAAARVVHQGCRSVLADHFTIEPVRSEAEGSRVTVTPGYAADAYRFSGRISGVPPFTGTLVHRGWRTETVTLPRVVAAPGDRLPTIAPAEIELT